MSSSRFFRYAIATWIIPAVALADGDPGAARAQLQRGYALKQQGKCEAAIPHFTESVRLDRHPKALLNLADCETKTGKWISAQMHTVDARDLARARGQRDLEGLAVKQLSALEKQIPRLAIQLAGDAPSATTVSRDGVELGTVSLGPQLPVDPGLHVVIARGGGFERRYSIVVNEGETKTLEVTPTGGTKLPGTEPRAAAPPPPEPPPRSASTAHFAGSTEDASQSSGMPAQKVVALITGGVGVLGLGASYFVASSAKKSWQGAAEQCPGGVCENQQDIDGSNDARRRGDIATALFVAGGVSAVTGLVLWLTAPSQDKVGWRIAPAVGVSSGGVSVYGRF